ncbi:DUF4407 domain-containing protein [Nocardia higoensis]|uniref:DUF4407 domain-containing protein n=1 Tax=Nocardia higoensis TaxID=228599 RepID=A0ABS0DGV7_9NOCA|nr:DUF4407 domain-containing protein [Nocardia higoensis]MBF6356807.1 DUF4407 domain-containing protein [Nocardia higoensis]
MSVTGTLIRLGGAQPSALGEAYERAGYALTGAAVAVAALVAGGVAAAASAPMWPVAVVAAVAAAVAAVAGVIARALVSSPGTAPRRLWFLGRVLLALALGAFLGEAATVVAEDAAIDRILDEKAHAAAQSAPGVMTARTALERALAERASLAGTIADAEAEADRALVTARCEFNPTEQCPATRITGVPGDGPEHRTAQAVLDDARDRLSAARDLAPELDQRVRAAEQSLSAAYAAAELTGDRGPGARWAAMHQHTTASATALLPRLAALLAGLVIALLPLAARRWLGVTSLDRHAAARAAVDAAERDAETAIAVQRARLRAAAAEVRAERELAAVRLTTAVPTTAALPAPGEALPAAAGTRSPAVDGSPSGWGDSPSVASATTAGVATAAPVATEAGPGASTPAVEGFGDGKRHTRVIAAIGGLEIGITEFARPVRAVREQDGSDLPVLGNLPFAGWIGPLMPSFVVDVVETATRPLRTARRAIDEVEELTFTLRHNRTITVAVRETAPEAGIWSDRAVGATVVDVEPMVDVEPTVEADSGAHSPGTRFH